MLEEKAIRGVPWTVLAYASTKLIGFFTMIALARLLRPSDFGLLAAATLVIATITWMGDFGLGSVLALRTDLDRAAMGTVLTLMLAFGAAIALLIAALAPLAALALNEHRVTLLIVALSVTVFLGALSWFYESLLLRELEFRSRFACLTLQGAVYALSTIPLAVAGAGVWSLVVGQVLAGAAFTALLLRVAPYRVRPGFDRDIARSVLGTGRGFVVQGGAAFLRRNIDYLSIARLLGSAPLGFYSMAFRLSETPFDAIAMPVTRVTFPGFARMRARQEDVRGLFLSVMRLVALVGCPVCVILSASARPFVQTVLGHKWLAMIPALAVLGIWGAVLQVEATIGWFLNSVGEVRVNGRIAWAVLVPLVPAAILAADFGSITTVSWVMTVSLVVTCIATVGAAARRAGLRVRDQWLALKPVLIASPVAWAAARAVESVSAGGISAPLSLLLSATAGLLAYLAVATLVEPGLLRQAARQLRRVVSRAPAVASAPAAPDPVAHTDFARPGAREMIDS